MTEIDTKLHAKKTQTLTGTVIVCIDAEKAGVEEVQIFVIYDD